MKRIFMWLISPFFGDYRLQYRTERNEFIWRVLGCFRVPVRKFEAMPLHLSRVRHTVERLVGATVWNA